MAPTAVSNAVKGAILFAKGFELLGFEVRPASWEPRNDIIQAICLEDEALMIEICRIVQSVSPLDSNVGSLAVGHAGVYLPGDYGCGNICTGGSP